MNVFTIFVTSLFIGLSGAVMPGPLLSLNIYNTIQKGIKGGLIIIIGHSIIEAVIVISLLSGLKQLFLQGNVQGIIGITGGFVLIWMGINMLKSVKKIDIEFINPETNSHLSKQNSGIFQGIFATLSNPYWYIWWATVGLNYILLSKETGIYGPFAFYFGHISSDFLWYGIIAVLTAKGIRKIKPSVYRFIVLILGVFLTVMGISFIIFGTSKLNG
ncbi:MAG: LysE family transporter [bacterium]|nr:LysE family transporter [bacterium]